MNFICTALLLSILSLLLACSTPDTQQDASALPAAADEPLIDSDTLTAEPIDSSAIQEKKYAAAHDTAFVVMSEYHEGFSYDMKYATADNFLKEAVYTCDQCLIRKEVADALIQANQQLSSRGLHIKFYDCYRPLDIQKQMWKIYPNAKYVANPSTAGSVHNRGGAVDITLVDQEGQELDMGTSFDHFGQEAHHAYTQLSDTVRANRRLLKETMESNGFKAITSEWWHYSYRTAGKYAISNFSTECT